MSAEIFETTPAGADSAEPVDGRVDRVAERCWTSRRPVDVGLPADAGCEMDFIHQSRVGTALIFAFVAAMGLFLALFATPTPVIIAGWVLVVVGGLLAFRQVAGGEAR
jgi:hypothetical protein